MENNLNNLPPFYVGQKVVYITGISMPKDSVHTVSEVHQDVCGCFYIGINGVKVTEGPTVPHKIYPCPQCKSDTCKQCKVYNGWNATSFRAAQQSNFPLMTFTAIKEKEQEQVLTPN